jgi:CRP-like cAMP-binding protein
MSKVDLALDVFKSKRRNSCLNPPPKHSTQQNFKRRMEIFCLNNSPKRLQNENNQTLRKESIKIKEFLIKIKEQDSRRNSQASSVNKQITSLIGPKQKLSHNSLRLATANINALFGSEKRNSHHSEEISKIANNLNNLNLNDSSSKLIENLLEIKKVENNDRMLKKIDKVNDSDGSEDVLIDMEEGDKKYWVLLPDSEFIKYWGLLVMLCLFYVVTVEVFILGFVEVETEAMILFSIIIDCLFMFDIIINFLTAYYDFNEDLVTNRKLIFVNYLFNGFIVDVVSAIPFTTIFSLYDADISPNTNFTLQRITKITKVTKLSRILRFTRLLKSLKTNDESTKSITIIEDLNINSNMKRFVKFFCYFLLFNHIASCIFVFLAQLDYPNWIIVAGLQDSSYLELYINSLYFNLTTVFTVGYGDIHSVSIYERVFNIIIMIVGILFYSFAITSLSSIVVKIDKKEKIYYKRLELLEEVRTKYRLSDDLYKLLTRFLSYDLQINRVNKKFLLNELPQQLKHKLISQMYKHPIQNLDFFRNTSNDFIFKAVTMLKQIKLLRGEYLIKAGHYLEEMYFVKKGRLVVLLPINKVKRLKLLHVFINEQFGEVYMCKKLRSPIDLKVTSKIIELFCLSRADFIELNEHFPKIIQKNIKKALVNSTKMELKAKDMLFRLNRDHKTSQNRRSIQLSPVILGRGLYSGNKSEGEIKVKSKIEIDRPIQPRPSLSQNTSPALPRRSIFKVDNQHLHLIDFNTADVVNIPIQEESSQSSSSSSSSSSAKNSSSYYKSIPITKSKNERSFSVDNTFNKNRELQGTAKVISSRTDHSSLPKSKRPININYNINIHNNVNINNYFDKLIGKNTESLNKGNQKCEFLKTNLKGEENKEKENENNNEHTEDKTKDLTQIIGDVEDSMNNIQLEPIQENQFDSVSKPVSKEIDLNQYTFKSYMRSSSKSVSNSHAKEPDNLKNSPEYKKIKETPLFKFVVSKFKERKSEGQNKQEKVQKIARNLMPTLFRENLDMTFNRSSKLNSLANLSNLDYRRASAEDLHRLSEHHFNDILENMKKDALVKKNPNELFLVGVNNITNKKGGGNSLIIHEQIDRLNEIFQTLLISTVTILKSKAMVN